MSFYSLITECVGHKDGKETQQQYQNNGVWRPFDGGWVFADSEYRIKPEPKTIWVNEYKSGNDGHPYQTKQAAINVAGSRVARVAVEYQEVIK